MLRIIFLILFGLFVLAGCAFGSAYDKIHKEILDFNIADYKINLHIISNKNENTYILIVKVDEQGSCMVEFLEPKESTRIFTQYDNNGAIQQNTKINDNIIFENDSVSLASPIFLSSFLYNYLHAEQKSIDKLHEGDFKIEVPIINGNFYYNKQEMIFDKKTLKPKILNIYDEDGKIKAKCEIELTDVPNTVEKRGI